MKTRVENRLAQIRKSRGVGASDLARRVSVSRQTIYAIEAGTYTPNTSVALKLARTLECRVEDLFSLEAEIPTARQQVKVKFLSSGIGPRQDQPCGRRALR